MFYFFKHGTSAEIFEIVIYRRKTFYKIIINKALVYGDFLQFSGYSAEADILRADKITGIALAAEPDQV
jgi:hypothetical protein